MTKKQMKKLAKDMALLEYVIQHGESKDAVETAKNTLLHTQESLDLDLDEMVMLDELIQSHLASMD